MANAKKCDRCGLLYEYYGGVPTNRLGTEYDGFILTTSRSAKRHSYDLCYPCMKSLIAWLGNDKEANNETN